MAEGNRWSTGKIVGVSLAVVVLIGVLCCGGFFAIGWFGTKEIRTKLENMTPEEQQEYLAGQVAGLAGDHDPTVEAFLVALRDGDLDTAHGACSPAFRKSTSKAQLAKLQKALDRALGAYRSKRLRNYNHKTQMGQGSFVELGYAGTYEKGEATISITLQEGAGGVFEVQHYRVDSPLLLDAMLGDDEGK